jgi:hypothetical protein
VELVTGALTGAVLIGDLEPPAASEQELLDDGAEDPVEDPVDDQTDERA